MSLAKAGLWVAGGILLGRIIGLARDLMIAAQFGVSALADGAALLQTLPDVLAAVITGGAIGYILIPEFKRVKQENAFQLFLQSSLLAASLFTLLTALLWRHSDTLILALAPGFSKELIESLRPAFNIALWALPLTALSGVTSAFLHSKSRFAVASFENIFFNLTLIFVFYFSVTSFGLIGLAYAVLAASGVRWLTQLADSIRSSNPRSLRLGKWQLDRAVLIRYFQTMVSGSLLMLLPVIARQLASFLGEGSVALLVYSMKFVDIPMAICVSVFAKVLFPRVSGLFAREETSSQAVALTQQGIRIVLVLSISVMISLFWLLQRSSGFSLSWKAINSGQMTQIFDLASIGLLALPAQGLASLTLLVFVAKRQTLPPLLIIIACIMAFVPTAWVMENRFGLSGLVWSLVGAAYAVPALHILILRRRFAFDGVSLLFSWDAGRSLLACLAGFVPVFVLGTVLSPGPVASLGLAIAGGGSALLCGLLSIPELKSELLKRMPTIGGQRA